MNRPHIVFRKRSEGNEPEYWTGEGWDRDSTRAKALPFRSAVDTLVFHRGDAAQRDFGFGVLPDGQSTAG